MVLKLEFDKTVETKFRQLAMQRFGYSKGALKKASLEAFERWIREEEMTLPKVKSPVAMIEGMLSHLRGKYTSVELQHEVTKLWVKKSS